MKTHPANIFFPVITGIAIAGGTFAGYQLKAHLAQSYIITITITTFLLYVLDKKLSKSKSLWRIPQWLLLTTIVIGGWIGSFIGIHILRHKSKTPIFIIIEFLTALAYIIAGWLILK